MIIDSHCHLVGEGWTSDEFTRGLARYAAAMMERVAGVRPDADSLAGQIWSVIADPTGEKLVSRMDSAGVEKACVFGADLGLATASQPRVSIQDQNRVVAEAARHFSDRLIPFFSIDPRRPGGLEMFQQAVNEWNMRGLKLYPPSGFYPYDTQCYPYYTKCIEYGIPVLFHTGGAPAPLKARFAHPICIDDVAADFPDLSIIMAHAGARSWEEALTVPTFKPNVYMDLSGWQYNFKQSPSLFYVMLRRLLDAVGPWRLFFGSDNPFMDAVLQFDEWVKAISNPDTSSCPNVSFSKDEIDIVMGKAFARLMRL